MYKEGLLCKVRSTYISLKLALFQRYVSIVINIPNNMIISKISLYQNYAAGGYFGQYKMMENS